MSDQLTFFQAQTEHRRKKKKTRLEMFLETLERVTPWNKLEAKVSRYYAKAGPQGGRPAYPLAMMLRIHVYASHLPDTQQPE